MADPTSARFYRQSSVKDVASILCPVSTAYTEEQKKSGARAILRQGRRNLLPDLRAPGGLDKAYLELHEVEKRSGEPADKVAAAAEVACETSWRDLLDTASGLDAMDGGVTCLIRAPGQFFNKDNISSAKIAVRVYVPPRELVEGGESFSENIARLVQFFSEYIARPHLAKYAIRCRTENVPGRAVDNSAVPRIGLGPQGPYLPPTTSCFNEVSSYPSEVFARYWEDQQELREAVKRGLGARRGPDDLLSNADVVQTIDSKVDDGFKGAIISIGAETDIIISRFHLDQSDPLVIPRLRRMTQKIRSSQWDLVLQDEFKFPKGLASALAKALLSDIQKSCQSSRYQVLRILDGDIEWVRGILEEIGKRLIQLIKAGLLGTAVYWSTILFFVIFDDTAKENTAKRSMATGDKVMLEMQT